MSGAYLNAVADRRVLTEGMTYLGPVLSSNVLPVRRQLSISGFSSIVILPVLKSDGTTDGTMSDVYAKKILMLPEPRDFIESCDAECFPKTDDPQKLIPALYSRDGHTDLIAVPQRGANGEAVTGRFDVYGRRKTL